MKPLYLEMKAFGSYQDAVIDFTKMDHGIFLITGDTGAGKTTIFDAIVYALYGKTSGGKRSGKMMRSQYARESVRTEVTLRFLYANQEYTIIRSPEQPNYKFNKKTGQYEQLKKPLAAKVELIMPDHAPFCGKAAEIDGTKTKPGKIEEIIGLNARQFTEIVMLAQGDFLKLLLAASEERKTIFARLFDTKLYALMEEEIALRFKDASGRLEENEGALCRELERICVVSDSAYVNQCERLHSAELLTDSNEELVEIMTQICEEAKVRLTDIKLKKRAYDDKLAELDLKLKQAQNINALFDQFEQNQKELCLLYEREPEIERLKIKLELGLRANAAAAYAHAYNRIKIETKACIEQEKQLKNWLEKNKQSLDILSKAAKEANEKYELAAPQLNVQIDKLEQCIPKYQEIAGLTESLDSVSKQLKLVNANKEEAMRQRQSLELETERLERQLEQLKDKARERHLLDNQIEYLRGQLRIGEPCPVCGQIHVEKKSLKKAKEQENINHADSKRTGQPLDAQGEKLEFSYSVKEDDAVKLKELEKKKEMLTERKKICLLTLEQADQNREALKIRQSREETSLAALKKMLEHPDKKSAERFLEAKKSELSALKEEQEKNAFAFHSAQSQTNQKQGEYQEKQKRRRQLERDLDTAQKDCQEQLRQHGFQSEQQLEQAFLEVSEITKLRSAINDYETMKKLTKAEEKRLKEEISQKERIDVAKLTKKMEDGRRQKEILDDALNELHALVGDNESARRRSQQLLRERERIFASYFSLRHLDQVANGKLSKKHLNFQTFMQRSYFKTIISIANRRLYPMSGGQFILQCRDLDQLGAQGSVGLDLDVYDIVNGQSRDVKTLSGGESFMAALSMALGLADLVQRSRGSVHIDTMFIDEGFGSLSEETRNQAVSILSELSEDKRLVGIISHVSELKNQIETQLVVKKTEKGSKAEWVNG